ncbi:MAG: MFS transporter [Bacteroidales bacterium]|jgi:MFS family permease|nr:MFS transporter [Bacteroidales bacterium]
MSNQSTKLLRDIPAIRWTALILLAFAMFFSYIFMDILSPIKSLLESTKGWDSVSFGNYAGSETFLNVFVFFLIFAGIILDKMGVRFTAILSGIVMLIGAAINWYAVTEMFVGTGLEQWFINHLNLPHPSNAWWNITPFFGEGIHPVTGAILKAMPASAKLSAIGFMIFGCGVEMAGITVSRGIVKWFKGKEMALAMGSEMAFARLGVFFVMAMSPWIANLSGKPDVSRSVAFGLILLLIALIMFIVYFFMDKKLDAQTGETEEKDDPFQIKDIGQILTSSGFWVVALLCVLYYSAIFPFQKYAVNMLECNLGLTDKSAGLLFSSFPLLCAIITPFLGNYIDKKGKAATMLIFGPILLIVCHLTFAFVLPVFKPEIGGPVSVSGVILAALTITVLGASFSLVPASLWPSVPKLVNNKIIGSAYALIFWIQNIGLWLFPMLYGRILSSSNQDIINDPNIEEKLKPVLYNHTNPLIMFACLGIAALILGFILKILDKKKRLGLELPNIKSK